MAGSTLGPTAQKVLELLRQNPGTLYSADDVCEQADCSTSQAQIALETLANEGLVEKQGQGLAATYVVRQ